MKTKVPLLFGVVFFVLTCSRVHAQGTVDSLNTILKKTKDDTTKCLAYIALGEYYSQVNVDSSVAKFKKSITLSESTIEKKSNEKLKKRFIYFLAYSRYCSGLMELNRGNTDAAIALFESAQKQYEKINDHEGIGNCYNDIGYIYYSRGNITYTMDYYKRALDSYKRINFKQGIAASYMNMAPIYLEQGDIKAAYENYNLSLGIATEIDDKNTMAVCLTNIAQIYTQFGNPLCKDAQKTCNEKVLVKALEYFNRAIKLHKEINGTSNLPAIYNNIGLAYAKQNESAKALESFENAIKLAKEFDNKRVLSVSLINLSDVLLKLGKTDEALKRASDGMLIARELGYPDHIKKAATVLKSIYEKQSNFKAALEMFQLQVTMEDSLNNEVNKKLNVKKQIELTYEKEAFADSIKHAEERKIIGLQLEKQKTQKNYLIMIIVISLISAAFIFNRFRITRKQKQLIESSNKELERLNLLNQKIFSVISHDFKGPITTLKILLQKNELISQDNPLVSMYINDVNSQLRQSDEILESLLDWAKTELQVKFGGNQTSDLYVVSQMVLNQQQSRLQEKKLNVVNTIPENHDVPLPKEVLTIVLRNLLSNAIKYSFPDQRIELGCTNETIYVKDSGKGIDTEKLDKLFTKQLASGLGTNYETGFGLGLYMCNELLTKYNAKLIAINNPNGGSTFSIQITR